MRKDEEKEVKRDSKGKFVHGSAAFTHPDNDHAVKLHTKEEKQQAYKEYCAHIAKGNHKKSFIYSHPKDELLTITWETMENYIKRFPSDFSPILMERAKASSLAYWEAEGQKIMKGQYKFSSPVTWACFMRNKFSWDKQDTAQDNATQAIVMQQAQDMRNHRVED